MGEQVGVRAGQVKGKGGAKHSHDHPLSHTSFPA
jgi:hypothetical protein